jgi:hypothetical protein
MMRIANE